MLAIVTPYYKIAFSEGTLRLLASHTNNCFSVLDGDDASTENPDRLLESYEGEFDFV